ncbi:MAG: BtpA family membrane complex biogenesis protein, partial [Thaumarchaeota archaeon]
GLKEVLIGSGLDHENARSLLPLADGAIVASCLRKGGNVMNPVDPQRVRSFLSIVRSLRR